MSTRIPLLLAALGAFALGLWFAFSLHPEPEPTGGYVLDQPRALPAFELVDEQGRTFSSEDFQGHWSVLYFGFTYCPDICPNALSVMAQVKGTLDDVDGLDDRYYLVSVDPDRDTPERLAEYVTYFDPAFHGVTGDFAQLDLITRAAGAVYKVPEAPEDENYLVAHSSTLTVIDPEGRIHAIFTSPFDPRTIARDLERLDEGWPSS
ncbi:MAG: SCO family protein [Pseudomonadota bacterium]